MGLDDEGERRDGGAPEHGEQLAVDAGEERGVLGREAQPHLVVDVEPVAVLRQNSLLLSP